MLFFIELMHLNPIYRSIYLFEMKNGDGRAFNTASIDTYSISEHKIRKVQNYPQKTNFVEK